MNKRKINRILKDDLFIFVLLVVIISGLLLISLRTPPAPLKPNNICRPSGIESGTNTVKVKVNAKGYYFIWLQIESPMQINFNDLPDVYNPLYVGLTNKSCIKIGENSSIPQNAWTWVQSSAKVYFPKGNNTIQISGSYFSFDSIELVSNTCIPINNGSNCN